MVYVGFTSRRPPLPAHCPLLPWAVIGDGDWGHLLGSLLTWASTLGSINFVLSFLSSFHFPLSSLCHLADPLNTSSPILTVSLIQTTSIILTWAAHPFHAFHALARLTDILLSLSLLFPFILLFNCRYKFTFHCPDCPSTAIPRISWPYISKCVPWWNSNCTKALWLKHVTWNSYHYQWDTSGQFTTSGKIVFTSLIPSILLSTALQRTQKLSRNPPPHTHTPLSSKFVKCTSLILY